MEKYIDKHGNNHAFYWIYHTTKDMPSYLKYKGMERFVDGEK